MTCRHPAKGGISAKQKGRPTGRTFDGARSLSIGQVRLVEAHDPPANGLCCRLCTGGNAQLPENVVDVELDRSLAHTQVRGDLLIASPGDDLTQHLELALRQLWPAKPLDELAGHLWRNACLPAMHRFNRL